MRRALFEWGAIVCSALSLACFAYWAVSITTAVADFETFLPFGPFGAMPISGANGAITVSDYGGLEAIEIIIEKRMPVKPAPKNTYSWTVPGLRFRCITWSNGNSPHWSLDLSLLIPASLMTLVAGFCIHRYRQIRRAARPAEAARAKSTVVRSPAG